MSAKSMAYLVDYGHGDLRKNIGCIDGILQVFDRYRFAGQHASFQMMPEGRQHQHEPHSAEKIDMVRDEQFQRKKPRVSSDSCSTSSFSSTLSSLETETHQLRRFSPPESPLPSTPQNKETQWQQQFRDMAMHRDQRVLGIKSSNGEERTWLEMKTKAVCFEGTEQQEATHSGYRDDNDVKKKRSIGQPRLSQDSKATSTNKATSIVERLMGLESFSRHESISLKMKMNRNEASPSGHGDSMRNLDVKGTSVSQDTIKKSGDCSRIRAEPDSCRQQGSVYGEIEKRINELQFHKLGKDLRALKQLLGGMQKAKDMSEEKTRHSSTSVSKIIPREIHSTSIMITKPSKHEDQAPHAERQQLRSPKHNMLSVQEQEILWQHGRRIMGIDAQSSSTCVKEEPCATCGRSFPTENLRTRQNLQRKNKRDNEISGKKLGGKGSPDRKYNLNEVHQHCKSQGCKTCAYSTIHTTVLSQTAEFMQMAHPITMFSERKEINNQGISSESRQQERQYPTLAAFYREGRPSPVKKVAKVPRDARSRPKGAMLYLEKLKQTPLSRSSDRINPKSRNKKHSFKDPRSPKNDPEEIGSIHDESPNECPKPDYRYINKILLTSGILENLTSIPISSRVLPSGHLIDPELFNFLEKTEANWSSRINRRMTFDLVDEILLRKMNSGRPDAVGRKPIALDCLLKEINRDIENFCRVHNRSMEEKEDGLTTNGDITLQLEEWGEISDGIPLLVLEIERLVFKDLIDEAVAPD